MSHVNAMDIQREVNTLATSWRTREVAVKQWYRMIQLFNDLKQPNMESVISSDPRTGFNMAKWLLTPRTSAFVADTTGMSEDLGRAMGDVESYSDQQLVRMKRKRRTSLWGSPMERLIGMMLATGWYAVSSVPTENGWHTEVWNPMQVYPEYSSDGALIKVGRKYTLTSGEANIQIVLRGWNRPTLPFSGKFVTVFSLWRMTLFGAEHAVAISNHLAKPPTVHPMGHIPIFTAPVGGLPDDGSIVGGEEWKAEIGQSLMAPIKDVQKNYDKMLTFLQQLVRDTANPRWIERVKQAGKLKPERLFQRGAIFSVEPDEDIHPMATPPLPPESQSHLFTLHNQTQRGLFSDISFGNITQQVSGFLMSQVTSSSKQTLNPFHEGVKNVWGEVATKNVELMRRLGITMGGVAFPQTDRDMDLDFMYDVEIPGDFIQRVSAARVANPMFRLATVTLHDVLFPEVQNSLVEQQRIRAEDATNNPVFQQVLLMRELARGAREARDNNDEEMAQWLDRAAGMVEEQSFGPSDPGSAPDLPPGVRPEALPPEVQEVLAGREG